LDTSAYTGFYLKIENKAFKTLKRKVSNLPLEKMKLSSPDAYWRPS
jgi:hypothetical protein